MENCRFENGCAYNHHKPTINIDQKLLNDKEEVLEKILHTLTQKVLNLEAEAEKGRKKDTIKVIEEPKKLKAFR